MGTSNYDDSIDFHLIDINLKPFSYDFSRDIEIYSTKDFKIEKN